MAKKLSGIPTWDSSKGDYDKRKGLSPSDRRWEDFDANCESIKATNVSDAECVALSTRLMGGKFNRVKQLFLSAEDTYSSRITCRRGDEEIRVTDFELGRGWAGHSGIGDEGARSLGIVLKFNKSIQRLNLVSCGF
jgi:hypothetical protein